MNGETPGAERRPVGPWGAWPTLGFGILVYLAMLLAHTLVILGLVVAQIARDPQTDFEAFAEQLVTSGLALALGTLLTLLLGGALILLFCTLRRGPSIGAYLGFVGVRPRHLVGWLGAGAALVLASDALTAILGRPLVPDVMVQTYRTAGILPVYWIARRGSSRSTGSPWWSRPRCSRRCCSVGFFSKACGTPGSVRSAPWSSRRSPGWRSTSSTGPTSSRPSSSSAWSSEWRA